MKQWLLAVGSAILTGSFLLLAIAVISPRNDAQYTWGKPIHRNKFGFRERNFSILKPKGVYRIMVIGDSLTEGPGLNENERYTNLLEEKLNEKSPAIRYEILNFGVGGYDTIDEKNVLEKYITLVQPNRIIVGFCLNDIGARTTDNKRGLFIQKWDKRLLPAFHWLTNHHLKFIARNGYDIFYRLSELTGRTPDWITAIEPYFYDHKSPEWKQFKLALREIKWISDAWHCDIPVFVVLNMGERLLGFTNYWDPDAKLRQMEGMYIQAEIGAQGVGFKTCNMMHEFVALGPTWMAVNIHDAHPNAEMNRIYAQKIYETLQ